MVDKVARPYCCQVDIFTLIATEGAYMLRETLRKSLHRNAGKVVVGLGEAGNAGKVNVASLGKRLQGVEDTVVQSHALKDTHRHGTCSMEEDMLLTPMAHLGYHLAQRAVAEGKDIDISIIG